MATPDEGKVNNLIKQATDARKAGNENKYKQFMAAANQEQQKAVTAPGWGEALLSAGGEQKLRNMGEESIQNWKGAPGLFTRGVNQGLDFVTGNNGALQSIGNWLTGTEQPAAPSQGKGKGAGGGGGKAVGGDMSAFLRQPPNPYEEAANKMAQQYLDMIAGVFIFSSS